MPHDSNTMCKIADIVERVQQLRKEVDVCSSKNNNKEEENVADREHRCYVISVPFGKGQDRPGVDMAPEAIKRAGLTPALNSVCCRVIDLGTVDMSSASSTPPAVAVAAAAAAAAGHKIAIGADATNDGRSSDDSDSSDPATSGGGHFFSGGHASSTAPTQAGDDSEENSDNSAQNPATDKKKLRAGNAEGATKTTTVSATFDNNKNSNNNNGGRSDNDLFYTAEEIKACELSGECCKRLFDLAYTHHRKTAEEERQQQQQQQRAGQPTANNETTTTTTTTTTMTKVPRPPCLLVLGGDHGLATGSVAATLKAYPDACVVWVDAHGDINVPELSPSGNYHGMPVAHLMKFFQKSAPGFEFLDDVPRLSPNRIAYLGLRDVDIGEREIFREFNIAAFDMTLITRLGVAESLRRAIALIDPENLRPIHLSFDVDGIDYDIAPGTGTRARGGLTYREALFICHEVAATGRLVAADIVEVNPELDVFESEKLHGDDPNIDDAAPKTVRLAVEMAQFLNGKTYCKNN